MLLAAFVSLGETFAALGTLLTGKRVRAWNRLCALAQIHPDYYRKWSRHFAILRKREVATAVAVRRLTLFELEEPSDQSLEAVLARMAQDGLEWAVFHERDDRIDVDLAAFLEGATKRVPEASIVYWDEEWAHPNGDLKPWIKPDWSERLHIARDMLTGASAVRIVDALTALDGNRSLCADRMGFATLVLSMQARGSEPYHLPLVLTRRTAPDMTQSKWLAVARRLRPDWAFEVRDDGIPFLRAVPPVPLRWPPVSVIVPTRDGLSLLEACLGGLARVEYPGEIEILVVDNGSRDPGCLAFLGQLEVTGRARVLRDDGPFNFSRLTNRAVAAASGELVCLLNNDVEALDGLWLGMMVRHALQPSIGAVGAQLLYPDGSIQHAGVAIGLGNAAGHVQRGVAPGSPEHAAWHAVTREVSAVTAACLLVSRENYMAVGGLDEVGFAVAFNDVDFCLKLTLQGLSNVYCVEACLLHAESRSRPSDARPDQRARFAREMRLLQSRWQTETCQDPHHSPLFSRSSETCLLLPV